MKHSLSDVLTEDELIFMKKNFRRKEIQKKPFLNSRIYLYLTVSLFSIFFISVLGYSLWGIETITFESVFSRIVLALLYISLGIVPFALIFNYLIVPIVVFLYRLALPNHYSKLVVISQKIYVLFNK